MADADDIPGTRHALLRVATKGHIYFFLAMALLCAALFIAGLVGAGGDLRAIDRLPQSILFVVTGVIGFSLFFPWFIALYFARHLLISILRIEAECIRLHHLTAHLKSADRSPDEPVVNDGPTR